MLLPSILMAGDRTHINFWAESGVWTILELTLVVGGVAEAETSQWRGNVPLGGTVIKTKTPTSAKMRK